MLLARERGVFFWEALHRLQLCEGVKQQSVTASRPHPAVASKRTAKEPSELRTAGDNFSVSDRDTGADHALFCSDVPVHAPQPWSRVYN